jgi:hypothetical protein
MVMAEERVMVVLGSRVGGDDGGAPENFVSLMASLRDPLVSRF